MADTVRYLLEEMIPELEDLEAKGYFSRAEIKAIVKKRQDFEYLLKRRATLKQDYLRYIEYEQKLEQLRLLRKKKLGVHGKKTPAETGIVRRIHFIYERATRKFKSDLQLWQMWIDFCRSSSSNKRLSKVFTKALQRHSTTPALWTQAAAWEFEHNGNVAASRALMQQGLRMCPNEEAMWTEYLRLELLYVHKLRARRKVLGLDVPGAKDAAAAQTGATAAAAAGSQEGGEGGDASEAAVKAVLTGAVARVVIKRAVAALPGSLSLRRRLLEVLAPFKFPGCSALRQLVYDNLAEAFPGEEEAWDLRARRHSGAAASTSSSSSSKAVADDEEGAAGAASDSDSTAALPPQRYQRCMQVYREALSALPSARMYDLCCAFLGQQLEAWLALAQAQAQAQGAGAGAASSEPQEQQAQQAVEASALVGSDLLGLCQQAHGAGLASEELCLAWLGWAERLDQQKVALKAARQSCQCHPRSAALWRRRLSLELACHRRKQHSTAQLLASLGEGLQAVDPREGPELWMQMLGAMEGGQDVGQLSGKLAEWLARGPRGPVSGGMGAVVAAFVQKIWDSQGLDAARAFYRPLLTLPAPGGDFFRHVIAMERQALEVPGQRGSGGAAAAAGPSRQQAAAAERRVVELFEKAVDTYGAHDMQLWLQYAQFEQSRGRGGGQVYWRACKELQEPEPFIEAYQSVLGPARA